MEKSSAEEAYDKWLQTSRLRDLPLMRDAFVAGYEACEKVVEDSKSKTITGYRKGKYPWDLWVNGEQHQVTHGDEYHVSTSSLISAMKHQAKARDKELKLICHTPTNVSFIFKDKDTI